MSVYCRELFRRKKCGFLHTAWVVVEPAVLSVCLLSCLSHSAELLTLHLGGVVLCLEHISLSYP